MKRGVLLLTLIGAVAAAVVAAALVGSVGPSGATASSHREAPLISDDPAADNTDTYAFVSPDKPNTVTIIANYYPFQDPAVRACSSREPRRLSKNHSWATRPVAESFCFSTPTISGAITPTWFRSGLRS